MKAETIAGLDPDASLAEGTARTVAVRLDEMLGFAFAALEADAGKAQHDMRIAAKRLRYVLEAIGFALGDVRDPALAAARRLQGVLGDLHDSEEMEARFRDHLEGLRAADSAVARGAADGEPDLRAEFVAYAPHRAAYRGLDQLIVHARARHSLLFDRFAELWAEQVESGIWTELAGACERTLAREEAAG